MAARSPSPGASSAPSSASPAPAAPPGRAAAHDSADHACADPFGIHLLGGARWDLPDGSEPLTEAELRQLRLMQEHEFHLRAGEIADPTPFINRRHDLVAAIATIRRMMQSRLSATWNAHQDDIGTSTNPDHHTGHESYASIFEYGIHLNEIAGGDYRTFLNNQAHVRLAGWHDLIINPRTVYFAAAAQVRMDERGRDAQNGPHQAGDGHWFATASVPRMLNEMQPMLRTLAPGSRTHRPVDGGAAILTRIQAQIDEALAVLAAQGRNQPIQGHQPDEHLEPAFVARKVPRIPRLPALPRTQRDDEVPALAARVLEALGHFPGGGAHEAGATDPHGTAHAMGAAYDMFDGTSPGANMWVGRADQMWPFIHYLIRRFPSYGLSSSLHSVHGQPPDVLHQLGRLLVEQGRIAAGELVRDQGAMWQAERADRHSHAERDSVAAARDQLRHALRDRAAALEGASTLPLTDDDRRRIEAEMVAIEIDLPRIRDLPVAELSAVTQRHIDALTQIVAGHPAPPTDQPIDRAGPLARLSPTEGRYLLATARRTLQAAGDPVQVQAAVERGDVQAALDIVRRPGFDSFIADVGRHPIYDQSRLMVDAMQDVRPGSVEGMHHWQVVPMVGRRGHAAPSTDDNEVYGRTLLADMRRRSDAALERILCVMAESAGGRQLLFGAPARPADGPLRQALDARLEGGTDAMLARVRARVVTPLEATGRRTTGDDLRDQLRSMGFYLPAASGATAPAHRP